MVNLLSILTYNLYKETIMKKFLRVTVLALIAAICACGLFACGSNTSNGGKSGLMYKVYTGDENYTVYGYYAEEGVTTLDLGAYAISKGITIERIQEGAFDGNETLTSIIVPTTVKTIDAGAFKGMKALKEITLPFIGVTSKTDAYLGETASDPDKSVDAERTFGVIFGTDEYDEGIKVTQYYNESSSNDYYLPYTLKKVSVTPAEEYELPWCAFNNNNLIETVELNVKVTAIGDSAFKNCTALKTVTGQEGVKTIYNNAFSGCTKLGVNFNSYVSLEKVGEYAFAAITTNNLVIPDVEYGAYAFSEATMSNVTINAKDISRGMFYKCANLTSVRLGANVRAIGAFAFAGIEKTVTFTADGNWSAIEKSENFATGTTIVEP